MSPKVSFVVEKADKGIRVMVKGKPESEELIPLVALKESIGKAAHAYTDKHVGPRERVGNKGGTLGNGFTIDTQVSHNYTDRGSLNMAWYCAETA